MESFKGQEYRDEIAKTLKEFPKDERRELWEMEKDTPEYIAARQAKIEEQQNSLETDEVPDEEFSAGDEEESISEGQVKEKEPPLPPAKDARAREIARSNPEELAQFLEGNGFSPTRKTELLQHYTQELEESIRLIAWTKRRLAYATAILEHTLDTSDKSVTSAENMIQNYLIFSKVFEEGEKKFPRFGQFAYVMRSIFGGITSKEEIYERIAEHKTFGEHMKVDREAVAELVEEVSKMGAQIQEKFLAAQEKKRQYEEGLEEARGDEDHEKGLVWTVGYAQPKEYEFPNYTFQTGPLKGQNKAVGRSSWEPMLTAYADVVNKRMEDRIMAKTDLPEEERLERIKDNRVELLYEEFSFPVDIKEDENGKKKPVVYILDFIDINRWRAIEVKGPLTPKAAEKIRLFKKYYVDGDFSDLPEEKKIVMMSAVQEKKDEIADWCHEHGYPVYDHFSSLEVLGAFKWDHDLNNFNRYKEARQMEGLSSREKTLMQKGFYKLVEDKITAGKVPDIRPEGYMNAGKIHDLVQVNESVAGANKVPYEVEPPYSTSPYIPERIATEVVNEYQSGIVPAFAVYQHIISTVPMRPERQAKLRGLLKSLDTLRNIDHVLSSATSNLSEEVIDEIKQGRKVFTFASNIPSTDWSFMINVIKNLQRELVTNGDKEGVLGGYQDSVKDIARFLQVTMKHYSNIMPDSSGRILLDKQSVEANQAAILAGEKIGPYFDIEALINQIRHEYEREFAAIIYERKEQVTDIIDHDPSILSATLQEFDNQLSSIQDSESIEMDKKEYNASHIIALKTGLSAGLSRNAADLLLWTNPVTKHFAKRPIRIIEFMHEINKQFKDVPAAVKYFVDHGGEEFRGVDVEVRLTNLLQSLESSIDRAFKGKESGPKYSESPHEERELISLIARTLIRMELGDEKYNEVVEEFHKEYNEYANTLNQKAA